MESLLEDAARKDVQFDFSDEELRAAVHKHAPALEEIMAESLHKDAKSEFQVWAQARFNITPRYVVVDSSGPDHAKLFTIEAMVGDKSWGQGKGLSKQRAAQAAATVALQNAQEFDDTEGEVA